MSDEMLKRLIARVGELSKLRDEATEKRQAIVDVANQEKRTDLEEGEDAEFRALTDEIKKFDAEIASLDERIQELAEEEERSKRAAMAQRRAQQVTAQLRVIEHRTYEKGNGNSYLRDLAAARVEQDPMALARLNRHAEEVRTDPEFAEFRDLSRADGSGGFFVPPAWLMGQWIELARPNRVTANLINTQPLPGGTDSINIPRVLTGTATAVQPADNDVVQEVDMTDGSLSIPVRTIAGQQDIAIQLLDQSPINFDEIIFRDLLADYAQKLNIQILSGAGTLGTHTGILNTTGVNSAPFTSAAPTGAEFVSRLANAINLVHTNRFASPSVVVMHPRRWAWLTSLSDSTGRPLVVPNSNGPSNAVGVYGAVTQQAVVGTVMGLPVVTDPSIPINLGAGTNEDRVLVMRTEDLVLFESNIRTRVLQETLSGTLTVRLQVYGYSAFSAGRYAKSTSVIAGTGLVTPTFGA